VSLVAVVFVHLQLILLWYLSSALIQITL